MLFSGPHFMMERQDESEKPSKATASIASNNGVHETDKKVITTTQEQVGSASLADSHSESRNSSEKPNYLRLL